MSRVKTLGQFIIEKQSDFPYAKGELSRLLRDIGIASKIVNREVSKAGLADSQNSRPWFVIGVVRACVTKTDEWRCRHIDGPQHLRNNRTDLG